MADNKTLTTKKTVEVDNISDVLGRIDEAVTIASDEAPKKNVFSKPGVDTSFIDKPGELEEKLKNQKKETEEEEEEQPPVVSKEDEEEKPPVTENTEEFLQNLDKKLENEDQEEEADEDEGSKNKGGRKGALIEAAKNLIEKGVLAPFEDAPDIDQYTAKDFEELIEVNVMQKVNETAQTAPMKIFEQLDPKLQDAIAYQLNGGKDVTSVLKAVTQSQEITKLSLEDEKDQERIVREWLRSINYGTEEAIEDEINSILDRGDLEKKATQFKPQLDAKQDKILEEKLKKQDEAQKRAEAAKKKYADTIYGVLNNTHLNGLPLNNKVQTTLYYGLTDNSNYQDRNGNPVNALGHLIEEYQFGENANPSILLEALWLMADPKSYRQSVMNLGAQTATQKAVRDLKTAEGEKITSSNKTGDKRETPKRTVKRRAGSNNIFSRD